MNSTDTQQFRLELEEFRGPIDLLMYLVRKQEVDVAEISLRLLIDQYLEHLEILKEIDINAVGDFIDFASRLVEFKLRNALPTDEEELADGIDPRDDLVQRLLLYKEFRDAASLLEEHSNRWQLRFRRVANDLPPRKTDVANQPIKGVELWDLVSSFGRVLRDSYRTADANIIYDETPIQIYMEQIHDRLAEEKELAFSEFFVPGMHKSAMIGVFLALLELARHKHICTDQSVPHGEILVSPGDNFDLPPNFAEADSYEGAAEDPQEND